MPVPVPVPLPLTLTYHLLPSIVGSEHQYSRPLRKMATQHKVDLLGVGLGVLGPGQGFSGRGHPHKELAAKLKVQLGC